jgi:hypothetical protein
VRDFTANAAGNCDSSAYVHCDIPLNSYDNADAATYLDSNFESDEHTRTISHA